MKRSLLTSTSRATAAPALFQRSQGGWPSVNLPNKKGHLEVFEGGCLDAGPRAPRLPLLSGIHSRLRLRRLAANQDTCQDMCPVWARFRQVPYILPQVRSQGLEGKERLGMETVSELWRGRYLSQPSRLGRVFSCPRASMYFSIGSVRGSILPLRTKHRSLYSGRCPYSHRPHLLCPFTSRGLWQYGHLSISSSPQTGHLSCSTPPSYETPPMVSSVPLHPQAKHRRKASLVPITFYSTREVFLCS